MKRAAPAAAALALLVPAAASAATTVDPAFTGTCARDATCKSITEAVGVAQAGDAIMIKPGAYSESVAIPADKDNLSLNGARGVAIAGGFVVAGDGAVLQDLTVVNAAGSAVEITGGADIRRSLLASTAADGDAVEVSTTTGAHAVEVDSSILIGGAQGSGIAVRPTGTSAGDVTLDARHVTIPMIAENGILLDNSDARAMVGAGVGNITANITGSIVHGTAGSAAKNYSGALFGVGANKIAAKFVDNDAQAMTRTSQPLIGPPVANDNNYGPNVDMGTPLNNPDATLFNQAFRLLVGSPAIDTGGPLVGDESTTDIDGDPRLNGGSTDLGADEFTNHAPVARGFTIDPENPVSRQPVTFTFDAADQDAGDKLTFAVDWGDGTSKQTAETHIIQHLFSQPGTYNVQFAVVDSFGVPSELFSKTVTVAQGSTGGGGGGGGGDVVRPVARIKSTKMLVKRHELRVRGVASSAAGVAKVEIALTRNAGCRQFTGSRFKKSGGCGKKLRWLTAEQYGGNKFEFITDPDVKIPKGKYVVRARATDNNGVVGKAGRKFPRSLVKLTVK